MKLPAILSLGAASLLWSAPPLHCQQIGNASVTLKFQQDSSFGLLLSSIEETGASDSHSFEPISLWELEAQRR